MSLIPRDRPRAQTAAAAAAATVLFAAGVVGGLQLVPAGSAEPPARTVARAAPPLAPVPERAIETENASLVVPAADPATYVPLYRQAAQHFGVNWLLIASIHAQETAFSASPDTYHGLNFARCCAGPMQFNVKNGKPSTWERFRDAYAVGKRPASYPHATARHPSVYDDYDAIMAA